MLLEVLRVPLHGDGRDSVVLDLVPLVPGHLSLDHFDGFSQRIQVNFSVGDLHSVEESFVRFVYSAVPFCRKQSSDDVPAQQRVRVDGTVQRGRPFAAQRRCWETICADERFLVFLQGVGESLHYFVVEGGEFRLFGLQLLQLLRNFETSGLLGFFGPSAGVECEFFGKDQEPLSSYRLCIFTVQAAQVDVPRFLRNFSFQALTDDFLQIAGRPDSRQVMICIPILKSILRPTSNPFCSFGRHGDVSSHDELDEPSEILPVTMLGHVLDVFDQSQRMAFVEPEQTVMEFNFGAFTFPDVSQLEDEFQSKQCVFRPGLVQVVFDG